MTTLTVQTLSSTLVVSGSQLTQLAVLGDGGAALVVGSLGASLTVASTQLGVLTSPAAQGAVGPPGPSAYDLAVASGFTGNLTQWLASLAGGTGIGNVREFEFTVTTAGAQTAALPQTPVTTYSRLYVDGLRQSQSSYSISGLILTLPADLGLIVGQVVVFDFA